MIITKWALLNFDPKYRFYLVRTVHRKMGVGMSALNLTLSVSPLNREPVMGGS